MNSLKLLSLSCVFGANYVLAQEKTQEKPNILWIVSEDNSAYFLGCYGNTFANTPNIDKLASQGFQYNRAYCSNAVSAPSRNTLLTGVYACSNGNENMRSQYVKSEIVKPYPEYLHQAGYYCTNNDKTDYNFATKSDTIYWDQSNKKAHYKNRPTGKPFFAVFNIQSSHEGGLHRVPKPLQHDPAKVFLPPYAPDIPEMRYDWARYYDMIQEMDSAVGELLKELEERGEAENTIVMYFGDNGGILPRSKRYMYETGTKIPLVVRIPDKFKHLYPVLKPGMKVDRIVNFVDFTPTLLSVLNMQIPLYMQGNAFLGAQKTKDTEFSFMTRQRMDERTDLVRSVRDSKFRYIRNYMPYRISLQHLNYLFQAPSAQAWEKAFKEGRTNAFQSYPFQPKAVEELYDTENDPWEVKNLASDPAYASELKRMRKVQSDWIRKIKDVGLIPERDYEEFAGKKSMYDYMRSAECPLDELIKASELSIFGTKKDINKFAKYLKSENNALRFWGVSGLLILKKDAKPAINELKKATTDKSGFVATLSAEALYNLGETSIAIDTYVKMLNNDKLSSRDKVFALNSIDAINESSPQIQETLKRLSKVIKKSDNYYYDSIQYLLKKWNLN